MQIKSFKNFLFYKLKYKKELQKIIDFIREKELILNISEKNKNIVRFTMAGCHVYISAYRILSDGSMSEKGVVLQSPYRETFLKVA